MPTINYDAMPTISLQLHRRCYDYVHYLQQQEVVATGKGKREQLQARYYPSNSTATTSTSRLKATTTCYHSLFYNRAIQLQSLHITCSDLYYVLFQPRFCHVCIVGVGVGDVCSMGVCDGKVYIILSRTVLQAARVQALVVGGHVQSNVVGGGSSC